MRGVQLLIRLMVALMLLCSVANGVETVRLKVRIADIDGRPIAGAKLFLYEGSNVRKPADFISPPSGEDGLALMEVPPGKYRAVARVKQGALFGPLMPGDRHSGEPQELELEVGKETSAEFMVADIRDLGQKKRHAAGEVVRVRGRVLDETGRPLAGAYVFAHRTREISGLPEFISAWTGADGAYVLDLPAGRRLFLGSSRQFPPPSPLIAHQELVPEPGKSDIALDIPLKVY